MTIKEKVARGLRCFASEVPPKTAEDCKGCPYEGEEDCEHAIIEDVIDLWDSMEKLIGPVKPTSIERKFFGITIQKYNVCGACGQELAKWMHFCPMCGRMVTDEEG